LGVEGTYKKDKDKHRDVRNREILVIRTVKWGGGSNSQRNGSS
jgi:hypothetical protein